VRLIVWLLATAAAFAGSAAHAQSVDGYADSRFIEQRERFTPTGGDAVDLRFLIAREAAGQSSRIVATARETLSLLTNWFGPLPSSSLTIAGVPWHGGITPESRPGLVSAPVRWLAPVRDQSTERAVIAAMVRQYWGGASPSSFEEAVRIYVATRAIHELLEGSNFAAPRFFGGFVSFPLRTVLLSPQVADRRPRFFGFAEVEQGGAASDEVRGIVRALQMFERYAGWPTMVQALGRLRFSGVHDAAAFADALSVARGTDIRALVVQCLTPSKPLEYALDDMLSRPGSAGFVETTLSVRRQSSDAFPAVPILVRFADGTEVHDSFDGTQPSQTLVYSAKAPALAAWIDPGLVLVVDRNRENNAIVRDRPVSRLGIRMALQWMAWLQNAMLSYTAAL
jgi:hypothetical protein